MKWLRYGHIHESMVLYTLSKLMYTYLGICIYMFSYYKRRKEKCEKKKLHE